MQIDDAQTLDLLHCRDQAERRCARRKRSRPDVIAYRTQRLERMFGLAERLQGGHWRPVPGFVSFTTRPKHREVHAARFSDRVADHLICTHLAPANDRRLSPAAFVCRPEKGTQKAVAALRRWTWRVSRRGKRRAFAVQPDIVSFFHRIDRAILCRQLEKPIAAVQQRALPVRLHFDLGAAVRAVLDDEPATTATRVSDPRLLDRVPPHKPLASQAPGIGLPIGNLTSQWFVNACLDPLDQFVQRTFGIAVWVRYVDDCGLVEPDPIRLEAARERIVAFLRDRVHLEVPGEATLQVASTGVDFRGSFVRPGHTRVTAAWGDRCLAAQGQLAPMVVPAGKTVVLAGLGRLRCPLAAFPVLGSPLGGLREARTSGRGAHCDSKAWHLGRRARCGLPLVGRYLNAGRDPSHGRCRLRIWPGLPTQRTWPLQQAPGAVAMAQFGRIFELIARRDARRLGLPWRGAGAGRGCGVPLSGLTARISTALALGRPVALALGGGTATGAVRKRKFRLWIEPLERIARWLSAATGSALPCAKVGRVRWPAMPAWLRRVSRRRPAIQRRRGPTAARSARAPAAEAAAVAAPLAVQGGVPSFRSADSGQPCFPLC